MTKFNSGWKPNIVDKRDYKATHRPKSSSYIIGDAPVDLITRIYDQKNSNSCVAASILLALDIEMKRNGYIPKEYSFLYEYFHARVYKGDQFVDDGTYIRDGCKSVNRYGLCKEKHWPYDIDNVNKNPGFKNRLRGYFMRDSIRFSHLWSTDICSQIDNYVDGLHGVIFGTSISNEMFDWTRTKPPLSKPNYDDIIGGHAMVIVDRMIRKSKKSYLVASSWGLGYGDDGCVLLDEDYIKWYRTRDFTVIEKI